MKEFIERLKSLSYPTDSIPCNRVANSDKYPYLLPVVPFSMVSLRNQLKLAGITLRVKPEKFTTEESAAKPYWIVFRLGQKNMAPSEIKLPSHESALNLSEGIALAIHYPEILKKQSIDLVGSKYGNECVPTIYKWNGKINLSAICEDIRDKMCGPAIKLKEW